MTSDTPPEPREAPPTDAAPPARTAYFGRANLPFFLVALLAVLLDQATKRLIEASLTVNDAAAPIVGHWLELVNVRNVGAAFSLFGNANTVLAIVAVVISSVVLFMAPRLPLHERLGRICMGLVLGGALGNLIDRLRNGYVTDMIHLQIPEIGFDWPVSNIADICINAGVIIMIVASFRRGKRPAA